MKSAPSRLQLYLDDRSLPLLEFDPRSITDNSGDFTNVTEDFPIPGDYSSGMPASEVPVSRPANPNNRYGFFISPEDYTPPVIIDAKQTDASTVVSNSNASFEWFLRYRFREGDPQLVVETTAGFILRNGNTKEPYGGLKHVGTIWDVDVWHKLPKSTQSTMELISNEIQDQVTHSDATTTDSINGYNGALENTHPELQLGELGPGNYSLFCRIHLQDGNIYDSNCAEFRILAQNPADGGRSNRQPSGDYGLAETANISTYPQVPQPILDYLNAFPLPNNAQTLNTLLGGKLGTWVSAMFKEEAVWGGSLDHPVDGYAWLQDWDCFSRAPESNDPTFDSSNPQSLYSDPGFRQLHTYLNNTNKYYIPVGQERTDFDNGFGTTQQTHDEDPFRHVNRWKHNLVAGFEELLYTDVDSATADILGFYQRLYPKKSYQNIQDVISSLNQSQQHQLAYEWLYESICKYNLGEAKELLAPSESSLVVENLRGVSYVNNVIEKYNEIIDARNHKNLEVKKNRKGSSINSPSP